MKKKFILCALFLVSSWGGKAKKKTDAQHAQSLQRKRELYAQKTKKETEEEKAKNRERQQKHMEKLKKDPERLKKYKDRKQASQQKYLQKLAEDEEKLEEYKARQRASRRQRRSNQTPQERAQTLERDRECQRQRMKRKRELKAQNKEMKQPLTDQERKEKRRERRRVEYKRIKNDPKLKEQERLYFRGLYAWHKEHNPEIYKASMAKRNEAAKKARMAKRGEAYKAHTEKRKTQDLEKLGQKSLANELIHTEKPTSKKRGRPSQDGPSMCLCQMRAQQEATGKKTRGRPRRYGVQSQENQAREPHEAETVPPLDYDYFPDLILQVLQNNKALPPVRADDILMAGDAAYANNNVRAQKQTDRLERQPQD